MGCQWNSGSNAVLGLGLGLVSTLTLTLTLKQYSLQKKLKIDPVSDTDPAVYWHRPKCTFYLITWIWCPGRASWELILHSENLGPNLSSQNGML